MTMACVAPAAAASFEISIVVAAEPPDDVSSNPARLRLFRLLTTSTDKQRGVGKARAVKRLAARLDDEAALSLGEV